MAITRVEPGFDQDRTFADRDGTLGLSPDLSRVLIVGKSQVNRIVVARIVERSGLKPVTEEPQSAVRILPLMFPGIVVLDGGADNRDCDCMIAGILALRRVCGGTLPAVVLLSTRTDGPHGLGLDGPVDTIVTKPFTTEQLQPVIETLLGRARSSR